MPELFLRNTEKTEELGALLAKQTPQGGTWLLKGKLGAGKTTWTRGFVQGLGGQADAVSSPTYAVMHCYESPQGRIFHIDLYRTGPSGIWGLGLEELVSQSDRLVVEWAGSDGPWPTEWVSLLELVELSSGRAANWAGSAAGLPSKNRTIL